MAAAGAEASGLDDTISLEDVATFPRPGTNAPYQHSFSPDEKLLTYLFMAEGTLQTELWARNIASGDNCPGGPQPTRG